MAWGSLSDRRAGLDDLPALDQHLGHAALDLGGHVGLRVGHERAAHVKLAT
jgi:hypothetical protein